MKRLRRIFMKLASVNTPSDHENRIMPWIMQKLKSCGFDVALDKDFNIIAKIGKYKDGKWPILNAHMDTVNKSPNVAHIELVYNQARRIIHTKGFKHVLGGDDKCGVAIILRLAEEAKKRKLKFMAVLTRGEEIGKGSHNLEECAWNFGKYFITIDRRNKSDVVKKIHGKVLCDTKFLDWVKDRSPVEIDPIAIDSAMSDASTAAEFMHSVNLSCGYYNPHTSNEYVKMDELYNSYKWAGNLINKPYNVK